MKPPRTNLIVFALLFSAFFSFKAQGQAFGTVASAVWLTDCNQSNFFNTSGNAADLIGPAGNVFTNANLGAHTQNSATLILRGAQVKTFKNPVANVCSVRMYYRIYPQTGIPGAFNTIVLPFLNDCDVPSGQFPSGGPCQAGDQKWNSVIPDGVTSPYAPINLTLFSPGNYVLEVYYDVAGSSTTTTLCNETVVLNNAGNNYKAFFSIQSPVLASYNPTTCHGTEGYITISGLVPGASYSVTYSDDGVPVGPVILVANGSGQVAIIPLNAGVYSDFEITINGCTTNLFTGIILSDPVFTPTFPPIAPFCAGTTPPILPPVSNNGLAGTWNPAVINNQSSGSYTFTPVSGQCGLSFTRNVTVIQKTTPTFSFGTSLSICTGAAVPALPGTSINGYGGTWSPSSIDNQNSATYTFTSNPSQCANNATLTVTVNPILTTTFSFGTALTICAGQSVPALPNTSSNGINGTWSPASVDNQNTATYTFTPNPGQCGTLVNFIVTVNPNVIPTFSFGTSLSICINEAVPALPGTSDNGITGTWNPAVASNQTSATYTFTPTPGLCAFPATFTVTVTPKATPTFSFGTSLTICGGAAVPTLTTTSTNGITGSWSPSSVDDQNSATYTFTPTAGLCANSATFTVTVNPTITPTFSFGTSQTYCAGVTVPALPATSDNGITGTWSPASVDNQNSGIYTFTPTSGLCTTTTTFTVTINPVITPTFSFGTSLTICAGGTVPLLPNTSDNAITGTWNPSVVSDQASATYTFTPTAGLCAPIASFTVTVTPNILPTFSFGTSLTICTGGTVPALPNTSVNGITGTWNTPSVDDQNSATYTFTPTAGLCATTATFTVTVNPILTTTFSFGTDLTICSGNTVPTLTSTSDNGISGTWNPATIDNQNSGIYTFTPATGQCGTIATFTVTVTQSITPTFSFGVSLSICTGGIVPTLPTTSVNGYDGTWNPAVVSNQVSAVYTFTPVAPLAQCITTITFTVTVNPILTPSFSFGTSQTICAGSSVPALPATSTNNITGTWNPAVVSNQASGVYTFTSTAGQCATPTATFTVTINPVGTMNAVRSDTTVNDGEIIPFYDFSGEPVDVIFSWTNSNPAIGLPASGTGNVPSFTGTNRTNDPISGTITVTPMLNGCAGGTKSYVITVKPLNKDVFVPNVFSPNGDGKNDILYVYGNYIDKLDMRIFNQWGQQVIMINSRTSGWDGTHRGKAQPVGVYVYTLQAVLSDGRTVKLKGSITLLR